jgi:hypothetical protein
MRQSTPFGPEFQQTISEINGLVAAVTLQSSRTLSLPTAAAIKFDGQRILSDLNASNKKLEELGQMVSTGR